MEGIGPPLVTPFTETGKVDERRLTELVDWLEARGVDFLVPCGSTSEAPLLSDEEQLHVIETVVDVASVPVLAGTGQPGLHPTIEMTEHAADAGVDAALVVTPHYYHHDQSTLSQYYRDLVADVSIPVYLYSVPVYTDLHLAPETIGDLATHASIRGIKDSAGDVGRLIDTLDRTDGVDFSILVGNGAILPQALALGATGGILALANLAPEPAVELYDQTKSDDTDPSNRHTPLIRLNEAITTKYGIPGLKWAMRTRGAPAGHPRSPHQSIASSARSHLQSLMDEVSI